MATLPFPFPITRGGAPQTEESPTFADFRTLPSAAGAGTDLIGSAPVITEIGGGWYGFWWDAEAGGEVVAIIDAGPTYSGGERYTFLSATRNGGRVLSALDAHGRLNTTALDLISITDVTSDADARTTMPKMLRAVYNRFYNRVATTATAQTVSNDSGTVTSTMPVSDDGFTATKGKSS